MTAARPPLPYAFFPPVPAFSLTSGDIAEGALLPLPQTSGIFGAGGDDRSPQLMWTGAPAGTESHAVTMFDPDAPTGSGFWHWAVCDIPASVTSVAAGAADLPSSAVTLRNDAGLPGYLGAAPPEGREHRYVFTVHALAVSTLGLDPGTTPALLGFHLFTHGIGRAAITTHYSR